MKTFFKLMGLAVVASTMIFVTSCNGPDDPEVTTVDVPTGLNAAEGAGGETAILTWSGDAEYFDIRIEQGAETVKSYDDLMVKSCEVTGLLEGDYTWKVRARKNKLYSDWSAKGNFSIKSSVTIPDTLTGLDVIEITSVSSILKFDRFPDDDIDGWKYLIELDGETIEIDPSDEIYENQEQIYVYCPKKLNAKKSYMWRVRLLKSNGDKSKIQPARFTTLDAMPLNNTFVTVEFTLNGKTQVWGIDHRSQPSMAEGGSLMERHLGDGFALIQVTSIRFKPGATFGNEIYPYKFVRLKVPTEKGKFGSFQYDLGTPNAYPIVDYANVFYEETANRIGDYRSNESSTYKGTLNIDRFHFQSNNEEALVGGTYEADLSGDGASKATIKVEFYMGVSIKNK